MELLGPVPEFGLPLSQAALLILVALVAGFVDAIAGGGGLITVPAMLIAGLPPVSAIATNKLQGTFGVASASLAFWRAGLLETRLMLPFGAAGFSGGVIGACLVHLAPVGLLRVLIPLLLAGVALYMLLSPKLGDQDAKARLSPLLYASSFGVMIGVYDGAFGPGAGTFYLITLILFCGFGMIRASAQTKWLNFSSNLGALLFFLQAGQVLIALGLAMGLAAALGAHLGARTTLVFGTKLVRPLVILVALGMALRLVLDASHPFGVWLRHSL